MAFLNLLGNVLPALAGPDGFAGPMPGLRPIDLPEGAALDTMLGQLKAGSANAPSDRDLQLPDMMGGINEAFQRNAHLRQQQPQRQPGTPGKFMNALGMIGDALAQWRGGQPLYQMRLKEQQAEQQRQQMGDYIANYLGDTDGALAAIMRADPNAGMQLYKMTHPGAAEKPAFYRELEAAGFNPQQIQQIMKRRYTRPIIVGSAATGYGVLDDEDGGEADTPDASDAGGGEVPTVNSQAEYDALPPGTQYRDSQGNIGVKRGGPTPSASGGFQ